LPDVGLLRRTHGGAPPGLLDFSSPSNPLGPPADLINYVLGCAAEGVYSSYPTWLYRDLYESLSSFLGFDQEQLVPLNGAAEALSLAPLALHARSLVVVEPNFGDHEVMARALGIDLRRALLTREGSSFTLDVDDVIKEASQALKPLVVIISRPNNPTGYLAPISVIDDLSSRLPRGSILIVDEAFVDLSPGPALRPREDLVILRSLTKAFSTPGLRLGVLATANLRLLEKFVSALQAWPVDSITACAFSRFLRDERARRHVEEGARLVQSERPRLSRGLRKAGAEVYEGEAPFVMIRHDAVQNPLFQQELVKRGIYVRDCSSFYGLGPLFSRVSVRTPPENDRLVRAVSEVLAYGPR